MNTKTVIERIRYFQRALALFGGLFRFSGMYPESANVQDGAVFDYVVAGGGTEGIVVASRLVEANFSVLVIEAGDETPSIDSFYPGFVSFLRNSRVDWNLTTDLYGYTGTCLSKDIGGPIFGKILGGTSSVNVMIYARGNPRDYEKIARAANDSSWKWEHMLKYFKKSEKLRSSKILNSPFKKYHGTKGKIGVTRENRALCDDYLKGFEDAGEPVVIDNVGPAQLGYSRGLYNILNGVRSGVSETYLPPLKNNPNLKVTLGSLVTKIIFDDCRNAVGVEFLKEGKIIRVKARKEVIVAAGPIKTPQLMMLSGVGPEKELNKMNIPIIKNLPVGKNLNNIVATIVSFKINKKADPKPFNAHQHPYPLIQGYSALNKSSVYPDYETQNFIFDNYNELLAVCGFVLGFNTSICDRLHSLADNKQVLFTVLFHINTKSRGEVLLRSTDPQDKPEIIVGYYSSENDLHDMVHYLQHYVKIKNGSYFKKIGLEFLPVVKKCEHFDFGSKEYWRCYALCLVAATGRHCGTCSIGSVVDTQLKVLGMKKLRIVDTSVLPNTIGGSILAPRIALAEKAAEMIIGNNCKCKH